MYIIKNNYAKAVNWLDYYTYAGREVSLHCYVY